MNDVFIKHTINTNESINCVFLEIKNRAWEIRWLAGCSELILKV